MVMVFWGHSLALLGFINIVYGSFCALAQTDFKKLVAYSSIGHMGFVILGLAARNAEGINGAVLQMFNHGVISAMLFLLVGVLYDRAHHREINGLWRIRDQNAYLYGYYYACVYGISWDYPV